MESLPAVSPGALPIGDAAAQLFNDEAAQLLLVLLGENHGLDVHVLLVHPVQHHGGEEVVDDGVDGHLRHEENQAGGVEEEVHRQGELAHGEAAAPLAQAQSHNVQPAAAAAAGQHDAAGRAHDDAPQQAGGEVVLHNGG